MYNKINFKRDAGTIARGNVYIANINKISKLPTGGGKITEHFNKTWLESVGSLSERPVLVLSEPTTWDIYRTVTVIPATTQDEPSISIPKSEIYSGNSSYKFWQFKCHDVRTINAGALYKWVGAIPNETMDMISCIVNVFTSLRSGNIVSILEELNSYMTAFPQYEEDLKYVYKYAYTKYPHIVTSAAPQLIPQFEVTEGPDRDNIFDLTGINGMINPHSIELVNPVNDYLEKVETTVNHQPDTSPNNNVEVTVEKPVKPKTPPIAITPQRVLPEPSTGPNRPLIVRKDILTLKDAYLLAGSNFITAQRIKEVSGVAISTVYRKINEAKESGNTYHMPDVDVQRYVDWRNSRFSGNWSRIKMWGQDLQYRFAIVSSYICNTLYGKIDYSNVAYKTCVTKLGYGSYEAIPKAAREMYEKLEPVEVHEIIPALGTKVVQSVLGMRSLEASILTKMCELSRSTRQVSNRGEGLKFIE